MEIIKKRLEYVLFIMLVTLLFIGCGQEEDNFSEVVTCIETMVAKMGDATTLYANALENCVDTDDEKIAIAVPLDTPLTKREALDILLDYYLGEKEVWDFSYTDWEIEGAKWKVYADDYSEAYFQEAGFSYDNTYILFERWNSLCGVDGIRYRSEWLTTYAVSLYTGEIMECIEVDEYGIKNFTDDYHKHILGEEMNTVDD